MEEDSYLCIYELPKKKEKTANPRKRNVSTDLLPIPPFSCPRRIWHEVAVAVLSLFERDGGDACVNRLCSPIHPALQPAANDQTHPGIKFRWRGGREGTYSTRNFNCNNVRGYTAAVHSCCQLLSEKESDVTVRARRGKLASSRCLYAFHRGGHPPRGVVFIEPSLLSLLLERQTGLLVRNFFWSFP